VDGVVKKPFDLKHLAGVVADPLANRAATTA
jgi:hypothetical protein